VQPGGQAGGADQAGGIIAAMDRTAFDQALARAAERKHAGDRAAALIAWSSLRAAGAQNPDALARLAVALLDAGEAPLAAETLRDAAKLRRSPGILRLLGQALLECRQLKEAEQVLRSALGLAPQSADILSLLGETALASGQPAQAEALWEQALQAAPEHPVALGNLAGLHALAGKCGAALALFERLDKQRPERAENHNNRGVALMACGRTEEAIAAHRRAVELQPDDCSSWSNLLFMLHYSDALSPEALFAEHLRWSARFAPRYAALRRPCANDRNPVRQIRVGYVSPDFRSHAVMLFLEPVLENHDPARFHVTCYHDSVGGDAVTARLKARAAVWHDVHGMPHESLADLVRRDRIDILVDLAAHAQNNRMPVFAMKPAPVQITYIAYPSTTALPTMDYRISDAVLDPPGTTEALHTEKLLRLPEVYWCYRPPDEAAQLEESPDERAGPVIFGSANRLEKVTPATMAAWARVLSAVPDSRLLLVHRQFREPLAQERLRVLLAGAGIQPERVSTYVPHTMASYLEALRRIDIALDTYPYSGGSTTCNLLWMGVPVIALAGRHPISRMSATSLHAVGLSELVAETPEAFACCSAQLAGNPVKLAELRRGLRAQMRAGPLMQSLRLVHHLEEAYRTAWRRWCSGD